VVVAAVTAQEGPAVVALGPMTFFRRTESNGEDQTRLPIQLRKYPSWILEECFEPERSPQSRPVLCRPTMFEGLSVERDRLDWNSLPGPVELTRKNVENVGAFAGPGRNGESPPPRAWDDLGDASKARTVAVFAGHKNQGVRRPLATIEAGGEARFLFRLHLRCIPQLCGRSGLASRRIPNFPRIPRTDLLPRPKSFLFDVPISAWPRLGVERQSVPPGFFHDANLISSQQDPHRVGVQVVRDFRNNHDVKQRPSGKGPGE